MLNDGAKAGAAVASAAGGSAEPSGPGRRARGEGGGCRRSGGGGRGLARRGRATEGGPGTLLDPVVAGLRAGAAAATAVVSGWTSWTCTWQSDPAMVWLIDWSGRRRS